MAVDPESQSQTSTIWPAGVSSDEQQSSTTTTELAKPEICKGLLYTLASVICLGSYGLLLASIVHVNNPELRLSSALIQYNNRNLTSLNITISAEVTVDNKNYGLYLFEDCVAVALYGNSKIGGGEISGGSVGAWRKKTISVVMRLRFDGLNVGEVMQIKSYAKMTGRVYLRNMVDRRKTIEMNCMMTLNLNNSSITDLLCRGSIYHGSST